MSQEEDRVREEIEAILEPTLDRLYHQDLPEGKYEEIAIKASIGMLKSNLTTQILEGKGLRIEADDQSLPEDTTANIIEGCERDDKIWDESRKQAQHDMLKDKWVKVIGDK